MVYPTSPSEVGLSAPEASFTTYATRQGYSTTQTVTNAIFESGVNVSGGATVTFVNCWWRQSGVAFNLVNFTGDDSTAIFEDCEFGNDGSNYPSAIVVASSSSGSEARFYRCYFHHVPDWGGGYVTYAEDCFFHDMVLGDPAQHLDIVQITGVGPHTFRRCYLELRLAVDSPYQFDDQEVIDAEGGPNRSFFVKPDLADLAGDVLIEDSYLDGVGSYVTQVNPSSFGFAGHTVTIRNNVYGPGFATAPHSDNVGTSLLWYGNTLASSGELIAGQDEAPSSGGSVGEYVQHKLAAVLPSSTSTTVTLDAAPASGSLIVLLFGSRSTSQIGNFVVPSGATQLGATQWTSGTAVTAAAWVLESTGATAYTVEHDAPAGFGGEGGLIAVEISNPAEIAADDFDWSNVSGGETTTITFPTSTPTASPWVAIAFAATRESFQGLGSWTNSFTEIVDYAGGTLSGGVYAAYLNGTGTSDVSTVATATSAERRIHLMAVFTVSDSAQDLTGTLHDVAPTFFTGTVAPGAVDLGGALLSVGPTFGTGSVGVGAVNLGGELTQIAPTFFSGVVSAGELALTGSLFQASPTFSAGAIAATYELSGSLFQAAPSFPQGDVANLSQFLAGTLFASSPTFFTGSLGGGDRPRRRNAVVTATRRSATLS